MKRLGVIVALVGVFLVGVPVVSAIGGAAPGLTIYEAHEIENVLVDGDELIVYRYSLPTSTWSPYSDADVLAKAIQGSTTYQAKNPAIGEGEGIGAFYLANGSGWTHGATGSIDMMGNPATFSSIVVQTIGITSVSTSALIASSTSDQETVCTLFTDILNRIEAQSSTDAIEDGDLVAGGRITAEGTLLAYNAFSGFTQALPSCGTAGVSVAGAFNPGTPGFRNARTAEVEASAQWARFDAWAADWGFDDATLFASLVGLGMAGAVMVIVSIVSGSFMYGMVGGGLMLLLAGMNAPHFLLRGAFVAAAIMAMIAGSYWMQRGVPR